MRVCTRVLLILLLPAFLPAQNILITFQKPARLFVCGADSLLVQVQNVGSGVLQSPRLTASLPLGLTYVPGTVKGASEQDISNPAQPIFALSDLAPTQSRQIALMVTADCAAKKTLDAGQVFTANLSVQSPQGSAQVTTSSFVVQTGLMFLGFVDNLVASGERGDTITRTVFFKNTRLGPISSLFFEDMHQPGIEVWAPGAAAMTQVANTFKAQYDASFFKQFGDGDELLELNEQASLTEKVVITHCGEPAFTNFSLLRIGWGCDGQLCQYDSIPASIDIQPSTKIPDLVVTPIWNAPESHCGDRPVVMGVKIWNKGKAPANDALFNFKIPGLSNTSGIVKGSFRLVNQSGTTAISPNLSYSEVLPACGLDALSSASFVLPKVPPKDSLLFLFDVSTCADSCAQALSGVLVEYFYKKPCPIDGFVSDTLFVAPDADYLVSTDLRMTVGSCLQNGGSYPLKLYIGSKRLTHSTGFLNLQFSLPHALTFDPACPLQLDGVAPVAVTTSPGVNQATIVRYTFPLPIKLDSVLVPLCIHYQCDTNMVCRKDTNNIEEVTDQTCKLKCFVDLEMRTYWSADMNVPEECGIGTCQSMPLVLALSEDCMASDTSTLFVVEPDPNPTDPSFKMSWNYKVYRLNLGLADDNDDRIADGAATATASTVRRDRYLPGDTLRVEYFARIDSGSMDTLYRYIYHEVVRSDIGNGSGNDAFELKAGQSEFTNQEKIKYLHSFVEVRYADGVHVICPLNEFRSAWDKRQYRLGVVNTQPPLVTDEIITMRTALLAPFADMHAQGCLPKPTLDQGDTLIIFTDFSFKVNFRPVSSNNPDPALIGFRTALSHGTNRYAWNRFLSYKGQYSGFRENLSVNQFSIKPCENSSLVKPFQFRLRIARENMFPFEVRSLAHISSYRQNTPAGLEVASAKLQYLVLQDSVPRLKDFPLPVTAAAGWADIAFGTAFANPVDEGFSLSLQTTFLPNCQFNRADSSKQVVTVQYAPGFKEPAIKTDSLTNKLGFFSNAPDVRFETSDTLVYSAQADFKISFSLRNWVVPSAPNLWLAVISPSGMVSNFEVVQMPGGQPLVGDHNVFQLKTLQGFSLRNFQLRGRNANCDQDSLLLVYGWGCSPLTSLEQAACWRDTFRIALRLQNPELELDLKAEPASMKLCETSDYFEVEIYNAKIGYGYDPYASVKLPPGLSIVPGSCQMAYPVGSAFVNIPNPELLPGNTFRWRIADVQSMIASNGLPGVNLAPQNALRIRFRTLAECGFVSNAQPLFGARAVESCGRSSNVLNKPGKPLNLLGLNPTYGVQVNVQAIGSQPVFCGGTERYQVQLTLLGQPSTNDSVYVLLPSGVSLAANSYDPLQNAPAGPPVAMPGGFRLPLPTSLPSGSTLQFQFTAQFSQSAGCIDQTIVVQTRVRSSAFCQSAGTPCAVYVTTGESFLNINPAHPELSLGAVSLTLVAGGQVKAIVGVNNVGNTPATGATVQIWQDVDGDGKQSAPDILKQTLSNAQTFAPNTSLSLSGILLNVPSDQLCGLLAVLPAAENCACTAQSFPLNNFDLTHEPLHFCKNEAVSVGVPQQPGATYLWKISTGIICTTCASTLWQPDPTVPVGQVQTLVLEEKTGTCSIVHRYSITVGQTATATVSNASICKGQAVTLTALPAGALYSWKGQGIQDPKLAQQTVKPTYTTTYLVTVTFNGGCTATAVAPVKVLLPDSIQLATLTTCPGSPVQVPGKITETPGIYSVKFLKSNGCDSVVWQELKVLPNLNTFAQRTVCRGDTLLLFDTLLTQSGKVCRQYSAKNGCDSTHCVTASFVDLQPALPADPDTLFGDAGATLTLNGPSGYVSYNWSPLPVQSCFNCQKIEVQSDSAAALDYILRVLDPNGCSGEITYRLLFSPPCDGRKIVMPNAFTPNGDGVNDVFRAVPLEGGGMLASLTVYDRWGQKVYESSEEAAWDGFLQGKEAQADVYLWVIEILCGSETTKKVGEVTLLR